MPNTRISYLYRDEHNYKEHEDVVVSGELRWEDVEPLLDEGMWFKPVVVGLPHPGLRFQAAGFNFPTSADHPCCELEEGSLELTDDAPTVEVTAEELLRRMTDAKRLGWSSGLKDMP